MALIIEDGSGVDGANTYASQEVYVEYASNRGLDVDDDDTAPIELIKAMDYLAGQPWKGEPVTAFQPLSWPRQNVYVKGDLWDSASIPSDVVNAQCALAMIIHSGVDLSPTYSGGLVTQETVGPLTTKYSDKYGAPTGAPDMPGVDILLKRWVTTAFGLQTVRA